MTTKSALVGLLTAGLCLSCGIDSTPEVWPPGPLTDDPIYVQYAVYYLPRPIGDPSEALRSAVGESRPEFEIVTDLGASSTGIAVEATLEQQAIADYHPPPDLDYLEHFGYGLDGDQALALQETEQVYILEFLYPLEQVWIAHKAANRVVESVARQTGGLIWDQETRQVFSLGAWREWRIDEWTESIPALSDHFVIHAYQEGDYVRAITLGMSKFGLPDIVVEDFPWSVQPQIGFLINLIAQAVAEGGEVGASGRFDLDLRTIQHPRVREDAQEVAREDAEAMAQLTFYRGLPEEGDAENRLVKIGFDRYKGRDPRTRQMAMLSSLLGTQRQVLDIDHNEELLTASARAREKLPALRDAFQRGLDPGEFITVKAPFATLGGGNEWMWVEVVSWHGEKISGVLRSEPRDIPSLVSGQTVKVDQKDVFDYIHSHPDGSEEGNETGRIIQAISAEADL